MHEVNLNLPADAPPQPLSGLGRLRKQSFGGLMHSAAEAVLAAYACLDPREAHLALSLALDLYGAARACSPAQVPARAWDDLLSVVQCAALVVHGATVATVPWVNGEMRAAFQRFLDGELSEALASLVASLPDDVATAQWDWGTFAEVGPK